MKAMQGTRVIALDPGDGLPNDCTSIASQVGGGPPRKCGNVFTTPGVSCFCVLA